MLIRRSVIGDIKCKEFRPVTRARSFSHYILISSAAWGWGKWHRKWGKEVKGKSPLWVDEWMAIRVLDTFKCNNFLSADLEKLRLWLTQQQRSIITHWLVAELDWESRQFSWTLCPPVPLIISSCTFSSNGVNTENHEGSSLDTFRATPFYPVPFNIILWEGWSQLMLT